MKKIEKFLCYGAGYTILIMTVYYLAAAIASPSDAKISIGRFFLILLFGFIVAGAGLVYRILTVKTWLKIFLHYAILLAAFLLIFVPMLSVKSNGPASVIAWALIFTALYALLSALVLFIRKAACKADKTLEAIERREPKSKEEYTPLYTDKDN